MITKLCQVCGKEYRVYPSNIDTSKYCSRECSRTAKTGRNKIPCICANCGEIVYKWPWQIKNSPEVQFCNPQCSAQYRKKRTIVQCEFCGKDIEKNTCHVHRAKHHFCSQECQGKWMSENLLGENHPAYNQMEHICEQCGKTFRRKPSQIKKHHHSFCSKKCDTEYRRTHPMSEEQKEIIRKTALKTIKTYPRETKIEKAIREWLEEQHIYHIPQYVISNKFCVDFYLPSHNVIIEAWGDYWHGNPVKYGKGLIPLNDMQKANMGRDKSRFAYLRKCGYSVYGFWECDIKKRLDELMESVVELQELNSSACHH